MRNALRFLRTLPALPHSVGTRSHGKACWSTKLEAPVPPGLFSLLLGLWKPSRPWFWTWMKLSPRPQQVGVSPGTSEGSEWPEVHCCRGSSPDIIRPPDLQVEAAVFRRCPQHVKFLLSAPCAVR